MIKSLQDPAGTPIDYLGADIEAGPLPAFLYFALSGKESLELHPYDQPALAIAGPTFRVFSFTIPGHEEGMNKFNAMEYWAAKIGEGKSPLEPFFEKVESAVQWLIDEQVIDSDRLGAGGLSRGGFVATHMAARLPQITTLLGFSPLTELMRLKEFKDNAALDQRSRELDLHRLIDRLDHVKNLRFYMGNLDTRVDTDACYHFIRTLAARGHEKHLRQQKIEFFITQSIGHKGHGTDPHIFEEGASWAKRHILTPAVRA